MGNTAVYGLHAVRALLSNKKRKIEQLFVSKDRSSDKAIQDILQLAQERNINLVSVPNSYFIKNYPDIVHQGVVAIVGHLAAYSENDLDDLISGSHLKLILILDGVTDPHNLGACLRSADACGVDCVIVPKDKSAPLTGVAAKVACGAGESVPLIRVTNLARTIVKLQEAGIWVFGAAGEAEQSLYELDGQQNLAIVLGAEGSGLRRLTSERCDGLFSIPMFGTVSSLNVSVATGVCLYEIIRQRTP